MSKSLYITEKPSVAQEFANALKILGRRSNGYLESEECIITWCVGHLVTMCYPEEYDIKYKRWRLETLPFLPKEFKYQVIDGVSKQFQIVKQLLNRSDVNLIYICTDSGREGEYIYRLVDQMAGVKGKVRKRVWIDSQTEEEILRGIQNAKDWKEYDSLAASAYLRAKEDYLMGINFSRLLTLKYGQTISGFLNTNYTVLSVGRVMTCVLGMVVRREREIREFVKTPFYRVLAQFSTDAMDWNGEWKVWAQSLYEGSPCLYKENGFKEEKYARELIEKLSDPHPAEGTIQKVEKKKEGKNPPLLYNLAELQNDCSKLFKISPDEALKIVQELYEKKMVTYPRTDARVLSEAVAKEIYKNISGLKNSAWAAPFAQEIIEQGKYQGLSKTRYVNDKQITDHYAIIPTGQGNPKSLPALSAKVYELITRRFLSIFYPGAVYQKYSVEIHIHHELFTASYKILKDPGYFRVMYPEKEQFQKDTEEQSLEKSPEFFAMLGKLKKGMKLPVSAFKMKEGETSPPKRYSSGSMILAMEHAGQLIEDEELRAQIKGNGIGTSATRAEILKKLVNIKYLSLNGKTQVITPTLLGELVFDVVSGSISHLLNPELTASWEKGLTYVSEGTITTEEYMQKLEQFVARRTYTVMRLNNQYQLRSHFDQIAVHYKTTRRTKNGKESNEDK